MGTDPDIRYEDPPPLPNRYDWSKFATAAKRRPGKWVKVFDEDRHSLVGSIHQGNNATLHPDKGFVVTTRNNKRDENGRRVCSFWLKYDPEKDLKKAAAKAAKNRSNA